MIEFFKNIDTQLFLFLNEKHNGYFDVLMWWTSYKFTWIPIYILLLIIVWKKFQKKIFLILISIAIMIFLSDQISVHFFKNVFERYRPCHNENIKHLVHLVNGYCGGQFGFVSSHAANSFSLAVFLSLLFRKKYYSFLIFLWAAISSYSRIYLGAHYPADVFAGAILGCTIGIVVFRLFIIAQKKFQFE